MKNDQEIFDIYKYAKYKVIPEIDTLYNAEEALLNKVSFFNKKKIYKEICERYNSYLEFVSEVWKSIYSSQDEYEKAASNIDALMSAKPTIPNSTPLARSVEQVFFTLSTSASMPVMLYSGKISKTNAHEYQRGAMDLMKKYMNWIDTNYNIEETKG